MRTATARRTRVPWDLVGVGVFALGFVVLYLVAVRTYVGQEVDVAGFASFQGFPYGVQLVAALVRAVLPAVLVLLCVVLGVVALVRRRWLAVTLATGLVLVAVPLSGWLRDVALTRPFLGDLGYTHNTLPSGHVTAAAALSVAAVLLWPWATRPAALTAGALITMACVASVIGHAHRPSDVVASVLLVGALGGTAAAVLRRREDRFHPRPARDAPVA
ncbi:phosphatase PAP2 family protein [Cellulosimicrobium arenosum]|uniref:Phosphatase PAP2 family protein n=1 Tax=Cellulosimicrobium arenosum TaxID=2708133 RepID=A0A927G8J1_9MICO|nr:phosphatase PAP2 family protein [Cellulosimicrobium arenosum]